MFNSEYDHSTRSELAIAFYPTSLMMESSVVHAQEISPCWTERKSGLRDNRRGRTTRAALCCIIYDAAANARESKVLMTGKGGETGRK